MYIHVRVVAGAKREKVEELPSIGTKKHLKISVKEPAMQNVANRRVIELVALYCEFPLSRVRLVSGHTRPSKLFSITE